MVFLRSFAGSEKNDCVNLKGILLSQRESFVTVKIFE